MGSSYCCFSHLYLSNNGFAKTYLRWYLSPGKQELDEIPHKSCLTVSTVNRDITQRLCGCVAAAGLWLVLSAPDSAQQRNYSWEEGQPVHNLTGASRSGAAAREPAAGASWRGRRRAGAAELGCCLPVRTHSLGTMYLLNVRVGSVHWKSPRTVQFALVFVATFSFCSIRPGSSVQRFRSVAFPTPGSPAYPSHSPARPP